MADAVEDGIDKSNTGGKFDNGNFSQFAPPEPLTCGSGLVLNVDCLCVIPITNPPYLEP